MSIEKREDPIEPEVAEMFDQLDKVTKKRTAINQAEKFASQANLAYIKARYIGRKEALDMAKHRLGVAMVSLDSQLSNEG